MDKCKHSKEDFCEKTDKICPGDGEQADMCREYEEGK